MALSEIFYFYSRRLKLDFRKREGRVSDCVILIVTKALYNAFTSRSQLVVTIFAHAK